MLLNYIPFYFGPLTIRSIETRLRKCSYALAGQTQLHFLCQWRYRVHPKLQKACVVECCTALQINFVVEKASDSNLNNNGILRFRWHKLMIQYNVQRLSRRKTVMLIRKQRPPRCSPKQSHKLSDERQLVLSLAMKFLCAYEMALPPHMLPAWSRISEGKWRGREARSTRMLPTKSIT